MRGIEVQNKMDKADHFRLRAQEMREIAEGLFDHKERKRLLDIAHEYENLALKGDVCEGYVQLAKRGTETSKRGRPQAPSKFHLIDSFC
jgi:hypothetical protein